MRKVLIAIVILLVVAFLGVCLYIKYQPVPSYKQNGTDVLGQGSTEIIIDNIQNQQIITSPLTITGKVKGSWYFEASFPVKLLDANGNVLVAAPAQAHPPAGGNWMTEDYVPFKVTLNFVKPTTTTGTLIFHNDNPSGLPQNNKEFKLPIKF